MRKVVYIFCLLFSLIVTGCSSYSKYPDEIKQAYNSLDSYSKETIIDWKKASVMNYTPTEDFEVIDKEKSATNIKGIETLEITFKTIDDETVGPIIVYVDRNTKKVLGTVVRK